MNKDSELFVRGVLDLGKRRKPQSFAADAASLWILNPNMLIVNELYLYNAKPRWRTYSIQCCLSMAQFSVRGACGFVLTGDTDISAIEWGSVRIGDHWYPSLGVRVNMLASQLIRRVVIDNKELLLKAERVVLIPC